MSDILQSIQNQIVKVEEDLLLVEERISEYPFYNEVPLDLVRNERQKRERLDQLRETLERLRSIPSLLPYLADRGEQEFRLGEVLQRLSQRSPSPIVCLIHGDDLQCHDKFLERLTQVTLPKLLKLDSGRETIKDYPLNWPVRYQNMSELHKRLHKNLADTIVDQRLASLEEVNRYLARLPAPVLIHTQLLTEDFKKPGFDAVLNYLQFWQSWPQLTFGQCLIVCLLVKYQAKQSLRFFKRRHFRSINDEISKKLETSSFAEFDRLICTVLPRLRGITRGQAENWVRSRDTRTFCKGEHILDQIRAEIRSLYESCEAETIPMDTLGSCLWEILARHTATMEGYL
jgi:hypothetical protein